MKPQNKNSSNMPNKHGKVEQFHLAKEAWVQLNSSTVPNKHGSVKQLYHAKQAWPGMVELFRNFEATGFHAGPFGVLLH